MRRGYLIVSALMAAGGIASAGWWRYLRVPPKISVVSLRTVPSPPRVAPASSSSGAPSSLPPSAPGAARDAAEPAGAVLDGAKLIGELDREARLTDAQRADVARVVREVAGMQARVDLHDDEAERANLQERLIRQLVVRLQMIVGEDAARRTMADLLETKPRIVFQ